MSYIAISTPPYPFFLFAGDALYRPGDSHRKRSALNCFDILLVEYGCLFMTENDTSYAIKENEILVLSPAFTHFGHKRCTEKTRFHWLHFYTTEHFTISGSFQKEFMPIRHFNYQKIEPEQIILPVFQELPAEQAASVYKLLRQLESLSINRYHHGSMVNKEYSPAENRLLQQKLFLELFAKITVQKDSKSKQASMLSVVIKYLETNYGEKISLAQMADVASCHPSHLIRCFRHEYGTTPGRILTDIRIQKAKELLATTAFSCEKIAEQTGFASAAYFSKSFRQHTGITPEKYRRRQGG